LILHAKVLDFFFETKVLVIGPTLRGKERTDVIVPQTVWSNRDAAKGRYNTGAATTCNLGPLRPTLTFSGPTCIADITTGTLRRHPVCRPGPLNASFLNPHGPTDQQPEFMSKSDSGEISVGGAGLGLGF
jgi:hypothetical protein